METSRVSPQRRAKIYCIRSDVRNAVYDALEWWRIYYGLWEMVWTVHSLDAITESTNIMNLSVTQAVTFLKSNGELYSPWQLRRLCRDLKITHYRTGLQDKIEFEKSDLLSYIKANPSCQKVSAKSWPTYQSYSPMQAPHSSKLILRLEIPGRLPSWNQILGLEHWGRAKLKKKIQDEFISSLYLSANELSIPIICQLSGQQTLSGIATSFATTRLKMSQSKRLKGKRKKASKKERS